jgi:cellobiose-specific phosphotransferase system component IIC
MMTSIVEAARGIAIFGVVALLASLLIPERYLKAVDYDRFTGTVVAAAAIVAGAALSAIFAS